MGMLLTDIKAYVVKEIKVYVVARREGVCF